MSRSLPLSLAAVALFLFAAGCASRAKTAAPSTTTLGDPGATAAPTPDPDPAEAASRSCRSDAECGADSHCSPGGTCAPGARCDVVVRFEYDDSSLSREARDALASSAECIRARGWAAVRIEGHADERGTTEYNLHLGQRRAEAVERYLKNLGLTMPIETISYGEEIPASNGRGEASWALDRRAEVKSRTSPEPGAAMVR